MVVYIYYIIPSTQHKNQSYRYMFRLNKLSSCTLGVTCHVTPSVHEDTVVHRYHVACEHTL